MSTSVVTYVVPCSLAAKSIEAGHSGRGNVSERAEELLPGMGATGLIVADAGERHFCYGTRRDAIKEMRKSIILGFLLPLVLVTPVAAQEELPRFELTPFGAYRFGGEFEQTDTNSALELDEARSFGLVFDMRVDADRQWEIFYSRQETELDTDGLFSNEPVLDIDVDYLHLGGTYAFDSDVGRPYIVATIGVSRFDPRPSGFDSETFFSLSFGGGVKLFPSKRLGLRLEGRFFWTLLDDDSEIFCRTGFDTNFCRIRVDGNAFFQWQTMAGLVFRF